MKAKLLFFSALFSATLIFSQYTTGTVDLLTTGMTVKFDTTPTTVTMTLTGDSNSMLGIGFGASGMNSGDDGFIYNSTANRDYTFSGVGVTPTADALQNWTVTTNSVSGTTRTIVATRSLSGGSGDFAFTNGAGNIDIYYARRNGSLALGNHLGLRDYATLTQTLATKEVDLAKKYGIYPNPVKEQLFIKNYNDIKSISIIDQNGKMVSQYQDTTSKIEFSKLPPGIYFLEIKDKSDLVSYHKIIKN